MKVDEKKIMMISLCKDWIYHYNMISSDTVHIFDSSRTWQSFLSLTHSVLRHEYDVLRVT